jgi:hypothetical protein
MIKVHPSCLQNVKVFDHKSSSSVFINFPRSSMIKFIQRVHKFPKVLGRVYKMSRSSVIKVHPSCLQNVKDTNDKSSSVVIINFPRSSMIKVHPSCLQNVKDTNDKIHPACLQNVKDTNDKIHPACLQNVKDTNDKSSSVVTINFPRTPMIKFIRCSNKFPKDINGKIHPACLQNVKDINDKSSSVVPTKCQGHQ